MPYVRITTFRLRAGDRARLEQLMDAAIGPISAQPGFRSITAYIAEDGLECGAVSVWDTRAQAEAITAAARDQAQRRAGDFLAGPPTTHIHEIYEPKG